MAAYKKKNVTTIVGAHTVPRASGSGVWNFQKVVWNSPRLEELRTLPHGRREGPRGRRDRATHSVRPTRVRNRHKSGGWTGCDSGWLWAGAGVPSGIRLEFPALEGTGFQTPTSRRPRGSFAPSGTGSVGTEAESVDSGHFATLLSRPRECRQSIGCVRIMSR